MMNRARTNDAVPKTLGQVIDALRGVFAPAAAVPMQYRNRPADGTRDGLGEIHVPGAVAQNATAVIPHRLGRVPVGVALIDNAAVAQTRLRVSTRSSTSVSIIPLDAALDATAIVRVF